MKRIDLLAKEYADSNSTYLPEILINAYRAGFRRAREMAADLVDEELNQGGYLVRRLGEDECE